MTVVIMKQMSLENSVEKSEKKNEQAAWPPGPDDTVFPRPRDGSSYSVLP